MNPNDILLRLSNIAKTNDTSANDDAPIEYIYPHSNISIPNPITSTTKFPGAQKMRAIKCELRATRSKSLRAGITACCSQSARANNFTTGKLDNASNRCPCNVLIFWARRVAPRTTILYVAIPHPIRNTMHAEISETYCQPKLVNAAAAIANAHSIANISPRIRSIVSPNASDIWFIWLPIFPGIELEKYEISCLKT